MDVVMNATKLVVRDADASERFYCALGMKLVSRNVGGEDEVRQKQSWLSGSGEAAAHMLILSEFLEVSAPHLPAYPGEVWLAFTVPDVEATIRTVEQAGGRVIRPGQDRPEHAVRAAVVADPEGHIIELVGPMIGD